MKSNKQVVGPYVLIGFFEFFFSSFFDVEMAEVLIRFFAEILSGLSVLLTNSTLLLL